MSSLERTKQGIFRIEKAASLEDIENNRYQLLDLKDVFDNPIITLSEEDYFRVKNGNTIKLDLNDNKVILTYNDEEIAIYKKEDDLFAAFNQPQAKPKEENKKQNIEDDLFAAFSQPQSKPKEENKKQNKEDDLFAAFAQPQQKPKEEEKKEENKKQNIEAQSQMLLIVCF